MSRSVIAKLFYGSLIAIVVAIALLAAAIALAVSSSSLIMHGPDVVGVQSAFGWGMVAVAAMAILAIVAASIAQLVAWIGALINTAPLENKTWFVVLLVSGILGFGLISMLVFLLTEADARRTSPPVGSRPATV
jgi:hypothetical protein